MTFNPQTEKARLRAILTSPEAQGREALAQHIAYDTDMSVERAIGLMKASPVASSSPVMSSEAISAAWSRAVERVNARVRSRLAAKAG